MKAQTGGILGAYLDAINAFVLAGFPTTNTLTSEYLCCRYYNISTFTLRDA